MVHPSLHFCNLTKIGQVNIPKYVFFITRYICCGSILIGLSVILFLVMVMYDNEFETKENKI